MIYTKLFGWSLSYLRIIKPHLSYVLNIIMPIDFTSSPIGCGSLAFILPLDIRATTSRQSVVFACDLEILGAIIATLRGFITRKW